MKIKGKAVKAVTDVIYGPQIIDRGEDGLFAFYARAVLNFDEFNSRCPTPTPPVSAFDKSGKKTFDERDPQYLQDLERHDLRYHGYYVLKTLEPTDLDLSDHGITLQSCEGWENLHAVLTEQLGHFEFARLMQFVDEANALDAAKMEANLETFFRQAALQDAAPQAPHGHDGDRESTNSGAPANGGA